MLATVFVLCCMPGQQPSSNLLLLGQKPLCCWLLTHSYRWKLSDFSPAQRAVTARFRGVDVTGVRLMPDGVSVHLRVTETPELRQHVQDDAAATAARVAAAVAAPVKYSLMHGVVSTIG